MSPNQLEEVHRHISRQQKVNIGWLQAVLNVMYTNWMRQRMSKKKDSPSSKDGWFQASSTEMEKMGRHWWHIQNLLESKGYLERKRNKDGNLKTAPGHSAQMRFTSKLHLNRPHLWRETPVPTLQGREARVASFARERIRKWHLEQRQRVAYRLDPSDKELCYVSSVLSRASWDVDSYLLFLEERIEQRQRRNYLTRLTVPEEKEMWQTAGLMKLLNYEGMSQACFRDSTSLQIEWPGTSLAMSSCLDYLLLDGMPVEVELSPQRQLLTLASLTPEVIKRVVPELGELAVFFSEQTPGLRLFRMLAEEGRLCEYWMLAAGLGSLEEAGQDLRNFVFRGTNGWQGRPGDRKRHRLLEVHFEGLKQWVDGCKKVRVGALEDCYRGRSGYINLGVLVQRVEAAAAREKLLRAAEGGELLLPVLGGWVKNQRS